jgi:Uma2 family endonuclease
MSALPAPIPPDPPSTATTPIRTIYEYDHPLTVEEFERVPEGEGKQELHDGRVVEMAPVGDDHGMVAGEVHAHLREWLRRRRRQLGEQVGYLRLETGYHLFRGARETRAPDVAFLSAERMPTPRPRGIVPAVPDLAVEVLSPGEERRIQTKVQEYFAAGVRLVWVIRPFQDVRLYRPDAPAVRLADDDVLTGEPVLPGFAVAVRALWQGDDAEDT